jgi:hypothetical protein
MYRIFVGNETFLIPADPLSRAMNVIEQIYKDSIPAWEKLPPKSE